MGGVHVRREGESHADLTCESDSIRLDKRVPPRPSRIRSSNLGVHLCTQDPSLLG